MNVGPMFRYDSDRPSPALELLRDFCKEELAAALTYERALTLPTLGAYRDVLERCRASHQNRCVELRARIDAAGAEPPSSAGVWGSLVPTLATAAAAVSDALAVSLLEDSEDRATRRYREQLDRLDASNRSFLLERVMPAQDASHAAMSELKRALAA